MRILRMMICRGGGVKPKPSLRKTLDGGFRRDRWNRASGAEGSTGTPGGSDRDQVGE